MSKYSYSKYAAMAGIPKPSSPTTSSFVFTKAPPKLQMPQAKIPVKNIPMATSLDSRLNSTIASTSYRAPLQPLNRSWDIMASVQYGGIAVRIKTYETEDGAREALQEKSGMFKSLRVVPGKILNKSDEIVPDSYKLELRKPGKSVDTFKGMRQRSVEKALPTILTASALPGLQSPMSKIERWQASLA